MSNFSMNRKLLTPLILCLTTGLLSKAQDNTSSVIRQPDVVNLGPGFGFDYGGLGFNLTVYPQKNIGVFFGAGYAFAGVGYNTGIKYRFAPEKPKVVTPFFMAMYGYNAAVAVSDNPQYNKLFYGPTLGAGIDIRSKNPSSIGIFSFALMVPIRNSDAQNYINLLKTQDGATFGNSLLPIGISIGYKAILDKRK
jgi:hypothetical protein